MQLQNITLQEYLNLEDDQRAEYDFFMRYSTVLTRPVDQYHIGDLTEQKFGLVKDLQFDIGIGMQYNAIVAYIMQLTGKTYEQITANTLERFCQGWRYITSEVDRITEIEHITLAYTPTDQEVRAGIDKLGVLGVYMQFRSIAQSLGVTIEQVKQMRYDEAFLELTTQKMLSEYEVELGRIRMQEASRHGGK